MTQICYEPQPANYLYSVTAPPMLVDNLIPRGAIVGLSGMPGAGKTWLALELSRALATGTPFLGKFHTNKTSVLFVGSDSSEFDYARQWTRLTYAQYMDYGGQISTELDDDGNEGTNDLNPLSDRVRFLIQSSFSFDDAARVLALAEAINYRWGHPELDRRGAGIVFIDTIGTATNFDLDKNSEMIHVYNNIRLLSERTGATIVLLHHNPKTSDSWLGAISQVGKLDTWMHLKTAAHGRVKLVFKKFRGIKPQPILYEMNVGDPETASLVCCEEVITAARLEPEFAGEEAIIYDILPQSTRFITTYLTGEDSPSFAAKKRVLRLLNKMKDTGKIFVSEESSSNRPAVWSRHSN